MLAVSLVLHATLLVASVVCSITGLVKWNNEADKGVVEVLAGAAALFLGGEVALAAIQSGYTEIVTYVCPAFFMFVGVIYTAVGIHQLKTRS